MSNDATRGLNNPATTVESDSDTTCSKGNDPFEGHIAIAEKTGAEEKITILNEKKPLEWVEADLDDVEEREAMR